MSTTTYRPRPGSLRARAAAGVTGYTLRPVAVRLPSNPAGVFVSRQIVARSMATFGPSSRGARIERVDERTADGRVRGEWVRTSGVVTGDGVLLYLHGSGYALCSPRTHRGLIARLSRLTGLPAFGVEYRLAPRHPFPAAADDVARAFDWLTEHHCPAERIVLAGDSAGGHLVVDLCLSLLRAGRSLPAAQVLFSPLADPTFTLARGRERIRRDPMVSAAAARRLVDLYTRGADPADARLVHRPRPGEVLPPTLIQAGGLEFLAADAHHLHRLLSTTGTRCELEVWPDQMHVFQALPRLIPEARPALARAARFLKHELAATPSTERRAA